jgi:hypothetical protein
MSGAGVKPKGQMAPLQKGKVATSRQSRTTDPEAQDRGKTRAAGAAELDEEVQEVADSDKGRSSSGKTQIANLY